MKILLTGASSFIGGHMATHLASAGHQVTGTYRTAGQRTDSLDGCAGLNLVKADLSRAGEVDRLPGDIDAVVHVAASSSTDPGDAEELIGANVTGTQNIVRHALDAGAQRFVYMSSLSVHGEIGGSVVDEHTPVVSPDLYGATKHLGERILAQVADRLPGVAVRLPGVLGAGAHRAWLPGVVSRARSGRAVTVYNPNNPFNNAVHVLDLGAFVDQVLQMRWSGFHAFPVGAGDSMEILELVQYLLGEIGCDVPVDVTESAQSGFIISSSYGSREFGYAPRSMRGVLARYAEDLVS